MRFGKVNTVKKLILAIRSLALAATLLSGAAHACSIFDEPGTCANPLSPQTAYQGIELSDGKDTS